MFNFGIKDHFEYDLYECQVLIDFGSYNYRMDARYYWVYCSRRQLDGPWRVGE